MADGDDQSPLRQAGVFQPFLGDLQVFMGVATLPVGARFLRALPPFVPLDLFHSHP